MCFSSYKSDMGTKPTSALLSQGFGFVMVWEAGFIIFPEILECFFNKKCVFLTLNPFKSVNMLTKLRHCLECTQHIVFTEIWRFDHVIDFSKI